MSKNIFWITIVVIDFWFLDCFFRRSFFFIFSIVAYETTIGIIALFAIDACFAKMFNYLAAFQKRTNSGFCLQTNKTRMFHRLFMQLNENDFDVRKSVNISLHWRNRFSYEFFIFATKNQNEFFNCESNFSFAGPR